MKSRNHITSRVVLSGMLLVFLFLNPAPLLSQKTVQSKGKKPPPAIPEFSSPIRITFGAKGNLLVSDYNLKMVLTVDPDTTQITASFPVQGNPLGIAYASKKIYVGNETNQCIDVYSDKGEWTARIGGMNSWPLKRPNDIAVDAGEQRLFVVDTLDKAVKIFAFDGLLISSIPGTYPDAAVLTNPTGIVLDTNAQEVFVSDYGDINFENTARIQVFSYDGVLLRSISGLASGGMMGKKYYFTRPQGLALDGAGHLFIAGCLVGQILVYDQYTGTYQFALGIYGSDLGQLRLPLDVAVDERSGAVFVTNNQLKRIEVFR